MSDKEGKRRNPDGFQAFLTQFRRGIFRQGVCVPHWYGFLKVQPESAAKKVPSTPACAGAGGAFIQNLYSQLEDTGQARDFVPDQGKFLQAGCRPARKFNVERGQKARLDSVLRL
ncbi:hypothetical protein [Anaerotruncus colihominis]|uniref:hypothetical protein n=1 Tax=Anaerotruncus colihominis TaxID=169435 RepID=UPI00294263A2|nr:hypothetical protein [Anaerotruncus colihominis]